MFRLLYLPSFVALSILSTIQTGFAEDIGPDLASFNKGRTQAINFLRNTQADDGSWTTANAPGITGLIVTGLLQSGLSVEDSTVALGLKHLESHAKKDGGIYFAKSNHRNYETCITILAFNAANKDGRYTKRIAKAKDFLKSLQWDKGEGLESTDSGFGGAGYGKHQRPDMSNTSFLVEALKTAGVAADDPAMINALLFISRSQNLESEFNNTAFAAKIGDGGFFYTPAAGGSSQAGENANGGLRSYGSMTYAGLKSMIYAGLKSDDKRVKAAMEWMKKFYTLDENPGLGMQGLYYYYHTFAKTMDALKVDRFVDADDTKHDWRKELAVKLLALQRENGSWVNKADRWYEGDPNLSTAYALMALSYCKPR